MDAIDRLHTTAESHDRVLVCEVPGRHAGWIATYAGRGRDRRSRGAFRHRSDLRTPTTAALRGSSRVHRRRCGGRKRRHHRRAGPGRFEWNRPSALPPGGPNGGRADRAAYRARSKAHRPRTPAARRQPCRIRPRAGHPLGIAAIDAAHDQDFGMMVVLRRGAILRAPLSSANTPPRPVDAGLLKNVARMSAG